MGRCLHHVVLTTGRVRRFERSGEAEGRIGTCANLLADALAGREPVVPGIVPVVSMSANDGGGCLSVALSRADIPFASPVVTIGIAATAQCGAELWRVLHAEADPHELATHGQSRPPEPWCGIRHDSTRPVHVDHHTWTSLEEFERCVAWAFLDRLAM